MSLNESRCFTCMKNDRKKLFDINVLDIDKISYLEKLKYCFSLEYMNNINLEICWFCIRQLRTTFKFKETVLASQQMYKTYFIKNNISTDEIETSIKTTNNEEKHLTELKDNNYIEDTITNSPLYSNDEIKNEQNECDDSCSNADDNNDNDNDNNNDEKNEANKIKFKIKNKQEGDNKQMETEQFECGNCYRKFNKKWKLQKHIKRVHNLGRNFVCSYCNKEFKQSSHLKEHITSHTGEKKFSCVICGKKFQRSSSQRRHMRSHEAAPGQKTKRTPFLCTVCGKSFPFSNGLQRHMRIHLGIKNYECNYCKRKFTQSTHLHVHLRTHTGEKPYICDVCGHKFSLKSCLIKHVNNHQCSNIY